MPISITAVADGDHLKTWRQDFGAEGDLNVTFDVAALTPRVESQLRQAISDSESADPMVLAEFLAAIVVDWDLLDAAGEPIPTTPDGIGGVPYNVLMVVWGGLQEVAGVGEPNGGT